MHKKDSLGFSKMGVFIIIFSVIALIGGGITAAYFFTKQSQTESASMFIDAFTDDLEKGSTTATYDSLDASLKSDPDVAYYSWVAWSSTFNRDNIFVSMPAESVTFTDGSLGAVIGKTSALRFTLTTNVGAKIYLTVTPKDSTWLVADYGTLN